MTSTGSFIEAVLESEGLTKYDSRAWEGKIERLSYAKRLWVQNVASETNDLRRMYAWTCSGPAQFRVSMAILEINCAEEQGVSTSVSWIRCNYYGEVAWAKDRCGNSFVPHGTSA